VVLLQWGVDHLVTVLLEKSLWVLEVAQALVEVWWLMLDVHCPVPVMGVIFLWLEDMGVALEEVCVLPVDQLRLQKVMAVPS
jgi:hypothetical protein